MGGSHKSGELLADWERCYKVAGRSQRGCNAVASKLSWFCHMSNCHLVKSNVKSCQGCHVVTLFCDNCCMTQVIRLWYGYMRLRADGHQLTCEAVSDLDGSVMDSVTLIKSEGWAEQYMQASGHTKKGPALVNSRADAEQAPQSSWQFWWHRLGKLWQPRAMPDEKPSASR